MCGTLRDMHIYKCDLAKVTWSQDVTGGFLGLGRINHIVRRIDGYYMILPTQL